MPIKKFFFALVALLLVASACASGNKQPDPGSDCPPPRQSNEACIQVVVWAKDPQTGACCQYGTPCNAPQGWQTFTSDAACRAGRSG